MNDILYIVVPAYNEEENIKNIINEWYKVVEYCNNTEESDKSRLVIIDDGSTDHTYSLLVEEAKKKEYLLPLTKENSGHGATILYGYQYALNQGANYIFQTDSDGQTVPEEFFPFWEQRKKYDMLIGYRNKRKDGISRIIVTKTLKFTIKLLFGVTVTDANTPFRLMTGESLAENIRYIPQDFNLSNVVLSVIYVKRNMKVKFIPITFRPRQGGVNSINLKKIIKIGLKALRDFRAINKTLF